MASNFHIAVDHVVGKLRIRLDGDFDGTSAFELIHMLDRYGRKATEIIIDTSGLKRVFPFGRDTFRNNLHHIAGGTGELIVRGKHKKRFSLHGQSTICNPR